MRALTLIASAPLALLAATASPAAAQDLTAPGGERVNAIIIYGNDPCPVGQGDEITVCARKPESERYRIPAPLREPSSTRSEAWNEKVLAYETVGRTGTNSCSPVGPGGSLGCTQKLIDRAYAERTQSTDVGFTQMIQDERARRGRRQCRRHPGPRRAGRQGRRSPRTRPPGSRRPTRRRRRPHGPAQQAVTFAPPPRGRGATHPS